MLRYRRMCRWPLALLTAVELAKGAVPLVPFPATLPNSIIRAAAVDADGNVYVTGTTGIYRTDAGPIGQFPVTPGAFQTKNPSAGCVPGLFGALQCLDAFVAEFSPSGQLLWASYLGGKADDEGFAIALDQAGTVWVAGYTFSPDFPVTANALQKTNHGGSLCISQSTAPPFQGDAFLTGVKPDGSALVYSSFLGGSQADTANALAIDPQGIIYLAGDTRSSDFPATLGSPSMQPPLVVCDANPQSPYKSGFVVKFDPTVPAIVYSTYFEQPIQVDNLAVDAAGSAFVAGTGAITTTPGAFQTASESGAAFVAKLSADGASRVYATQLGHHIQAGIGSATGLAVDAAGAAWAVGRTDSPDFPVTLPPPQSTGAFVTRLKADGSSLLFSAVGAAGDGAGKVLFDLSGNAYVSGFVQPVTFSLTPDALETSACYSSAPPSLASAIVLTKWSPQGDLLYASFSRRRGHCHR